MDLVLLAGHPTWKLEIRNGSSGERQFLKWEAIIKNKNVVSEITTGELGGEKVCSGGHNKIP